MNYSSRQTRLVLCSRPTNEHFKKTNTVTYLKACIRKRNVNIQVLTRLCEKGKNVSPKARSFIYKHITNYLEHCCSVKRVKFLTGTGVMEIIKQIPDKQSFVTASWHFTFYFLPPYKTRIKFQLCISIFRGGTG